MQEIRKISNLIAKFFKKYLIFFEKCVTYFNILINHKNKRSYDLLIKLFIFTYKIKQ